MATTLAREMPRQIENALLWVVSNVGRRDLVVFDFGLVLEGGAWLGVPPNASGASGGGLGAAPPSAWFGFMDVNLAFPLLFPRKDNDPSMGNLLSAGPL